MLAPFITTSAQSGNHQKSWWPTASSRPLPLPSLKSHGNSWGESCTTLGGQHSTEPFLPGLNSRYSGKTRKIHVLNQSKSVTWSSQARSFCFSGGTYLTHKKPKGSCGSVMAISWCSGSHSSGSENMNRLVCHYVSARCTLHLFPSILICTRNAFRLKRSTMTTRIQISSCTFKDRCVFAGKYDYWLPPISLPKWNKNSEVGSACDSNAHKNTTFSTACRQTGQL